jgi:hypothetical protein
LFALVQASAVPTVPVYEPAQVEFRAREKALFGQMVVEMKLLSWARPARASEGSSVLIES